MRDMFDRGVSVRAIAVLRILVGPIVIVHLWLFLADATPERYFADGFYVPFFEWWPILELGTYRALLIGAMVTAVTLSLGIATRLSAAYTLGFVSFNVLSNQIFFHHNRAFLMSILFGLTLIPCGRVLSVDAWIARRSGRPLDDVTPLWRLVLFRFLACTPYLASGFSKLIDPDWWGGAVMRDRILRFRHVAEHKGVPAGLIDPIASPEFNAVFWKFIVLTELFIGLGYWFGRTRVAAMFMALSFHVIIEVTSTVSVFSYLGICATLIWVTPETRDRVVWARPRTARRLRRLDWLGRFEIREHDADLAVRDRDGTRYEGREARWLVLSRLPVTMPLFAPMLLRIRTPRA